MILICVETDISCCLILNFAQLLVEKLIDTDLRFFILSFAVVNCTFNLVSVTETQFFEARYAISYFSRNFSVIQEIS